MTKWQYCTIKYSYDEDYWFTPDFFINLYKNSSSEMLEIMGDLGWELVTIIQSPSSKQFYFKKPKEEVSDKPLS